MNSWLSPVSPPDCVKVFFAGWLRNVISPCLRCCVCGWLFAYCWALVLIAWFWFSCESIDCVCRYPVSLSFACSRVVGFCPFIVECICSVVWYTFWLMVCCCACSGVSRIGLMSNPVVNVFPGERVVFVSPVIAAVTLAVYFGDAIMLPDGVYWFPLPPDGLSFPPLPNIGTPGNPGEGDGLGLGDGLGEGLGDGEGLGLGEGDGEALGLGDGLGLGLGDGEGDGLYKNDSGDGVEDDELLLELDSTFSIDAFDEDVIELVDELRESKMLLGLIDCCEEGMLCILEGMLLVSERMFDVDGLLVGVNDCILMSNVVLGLLELSDSNNGFDSGVIDDFELER